MPRALIVLLVFSLVLPLRAQDIPVTPETQAFADFTRDWRNDPVWNDKVEVAVYDVTRTIDGKAVTYQARVTTNKELADPNTKVKSATNQGREVFKQLTREDIPLGSDTLHVSTMVYVGVADLKSLRIDASTQDATGSTFKWFANHKGSLEWHQFSYHPGEGHKTGTYAPPENSVFKDALPVVFRGYPFDKPADLQVQLLPSQASDKLTPAAPRRAYLRFLRRETLEVPRGKTDAYRLQVYFDENEDGSTHLGAAATTDYWLAADPQLLHLLVKYQAPGGATLTLRSVAFDKIEQK